MLGFAFQNVGGMW